MEGKVRLSIDMVKLFDGEGDFITSLAKSKAGRLMQKIPDLVSFIPLLLEGDALAKYLHLSEEDLLDADKIEITLKTALMEGTFSAYT